MSGVKGRAALLSALLVLSGGAAAQGDEALPEMSKAFRACYAEAYVPWLVDLMTAVKDPGTPLDVGLDRLVRGGAETRARVRGYVEARRAGQYPDIHSMAAGAFNVCMAGKGDLAYRSDLLRGCFAEQEVLFDAQALRFFDLKSLDEATAITVQRYAHGNPARDAAVRRLTRDVYVVMKSLDGAPAVTESEFQLCMSVSRFAPSL